MFRSWSLVSLALAVIALASPAFADPVRVGDLVIETPWARASIGTSRPAAAYVSIENQGRSADTLIGIETSVAAKPEIHKMEMQDGVMRMGPAGPLEIPANGSVKLSPGGLHIMLMALQQPLKKGERFPMTLLFERAGRIEVSVPIYSVGSSGPKE